jgi:uncharacterized membrane protein YidH (DUF202 family)
VSDRLGRLLLLAAAVPAGTYASWLLVTSPAEQWSALLVWLAGGVVLHDLVLAPVLLAMGVASRMLPAHARTPAAIGLVIWGSVTLLAVPVLGRFGEREDNATLLDRPYLVSWCVGAVVTVVAVAVVAAWRQRRSGDDTAAPSKRVSLS